MADIKGNKKSLLKGRSDGITCCFSECFNKSWRNAEVNNIFPTVHALREKWKVHTERENFILTRQPSIFDTLWMWEEELRVQCSNLICWMCICAVSVDIIRVWVPKQEVFRRQAFIRTVRNLEVGLMTQLLTIIPCRRVSLRKRAIGNLFITWLLSSWPALWRHQSPSLNLLHDVVILTT